MAKYLMGVNHARQRRFLFYAKRFLLVAIILVAAAIVVILIDSRLQKRRAETPSDPTKAVSSTVAPSVEVFNSPYFQFQTNKDWRFIANESTNAKFVYRRGVNNLVSGDMTVYINSSPADIQATRVLPVTLKEDGKSLDSSFVSDHCNKNLTPVQKENKGELVLTLNSVRFLCDVDGTQYTVVVGLENSGPIMSILRPDGTKADYFIYFRDLDAVADPRVFEEIMDSFQIR